MEEGTIGHTVVFYYALPLRVSVTRPLPHLDLSETSLIRSIWVRKIPDWCAYSFLAQLGSRKMVYSGYSTGMYRLPKVRNE